MIDKQKIIFYIAAGILLLLPIAGVAPKIVMAQSENSLSDQTQKPQNILGEQFYEEEGKIIVQRVLSNEPAIETSFTGTGTIANLNLTVRDTGTYITTPRADGKLFGDGQGFVVTDNGEVATWTGQGIGRFESDGTIVFYGALFYNTSSEKLAFLNDIVGIFRYEIDQQGNTFAQVWQLGGENK